MQDDATTSDIGGNRGDGGDDAGAANRRACPALDDGRSDNSDAAAAGPTAATAG